MTDTERTAFKTFRLDRIRELKDGYDALCGEKASLVEISRSYNRYRLQNEYATYPKLSKPTLRMLCDEAFGDSRGKDLWTHITVFMEAEDVEDFQKEHDAKEEEKEPTEGVSSEKMANYILNSENNVELIRGLIEDKRALSFEIDELETKVESLQKYEIQNKVFIGHLIERLAEVYRKPSSPE